MGCLADRADLPGPAGAETPLGRITLPLGELALGLVSLAILVFPSQVLFLFQGTSYPGWQTAAAVGLLVAAGMLVRTARNRRGGSPPAGAGLHDRSQADRIRDEVAARTAMVAQYASTAAVVILTAMSSPRMTTAFLDGWVLLLLALVLGLEVQGHGWSGETLRDGFRGPDPLVGRRTFDLWWGVCWALLLFITVRASAEGAGMRDVSVLRYALVTLGAFLSGVLPFPIVWSRRDAVLAAWLRRRPDRQHEFDALIGEDRHG